MKGFTLIELLVVIAILAIIAGIFVASVNGVDTTKSCEHYGNWEVSQIPARCASFFNLNITK